MAKKKKKKWKQAPHNSPTKPTSSRSTQQPQQTAQSETRLPENRKLVFVKRGFAALITAIGLAIGVYQIHPVLTASALQPNGDLIKERFLVVNTGQATIRNVMVECRPNKVVFDNQHTLALEGYISYSAYSTTELLRENRLLLIVRSRGDCTLTSKKDGSPMESYARRRPLPQSTSRSKMARPC